VFSKSGHGGQNGLADVELEWIWWISHKLNPFSSTPLMEQKKGWTFFLLPMHTRVARWVVFKPKIPVWVNFGGSCNGKCWHILCSVEIIYGHLVYFYVHLIYVYCGRFVNFTHFAYCSEKNLATLMYVHT
jgi:hypothetical protein